MIHFNLICANDHEFEGWFQSGAAFEAQAKKSQIACPVCDDAKITKALMAPAVSPKSAGGAVARPAKGFGEAAAMHKALNELRDTVERNCENVGDKFAEEARKIHYGETDARGIYGQSTNEEARDLKDEGVDFTRLPWPKRTDS